MIYDLFSDETLSIGQRSKTSLQHDRMEASGSRPQAIDLKQSCSEQACFNGPGTGLERILNKLSRYSMFHLSFVYWAAGMASLARLFSSFREAGTNGHLDFILSWQTSKDTLNKIPGCL